jgi:hypothetical protein
VAIVARGVDMRASPYDLAGLPALYPGYNEHTSLSGLCAEPVTDRQNTALFLWQTILSYRVDLGLPLTPIRVETVEGRKEYQQHQLDLCNRAQPLRRALLAVYDQLLMRTWPSLEDLGDQ